VGSLPPSKPPPAWHRPALDLRAGCVVVPIIPQTAEKLSPSLRIDDHGGRRRQQQQALNLKVDSSKFANAVLEKLQRRDTKRGKAPRESAARDGASSDGCLRPRHVC
jgi:hypothetical protein